MNEDRLAAVMRYANRNRLTMQKNSRKTEVYNNIKQRCRNPKSPSWRWYGGKGIKCKLTRTEFAYLWQRDKAWLLKRPSIDRLDSNGHYELSNCRFIELSENVRRAHAKKQDQSNAPVSMTDPDTETDNLTTDDKTYEASTGTAFNCAELSGGPEIANKQF